MTELHMMWIRAAADVTSYRRMYLLAAEITGCDLVGRDTRHAARRVVRALEDVIDKPIADAIVLARARQRFTELQMVLEKASQKSPIAILSTTNQVAISDGERFPPARQSNAAR